jgi:heme/copper-type cytochrome/quinol oxidase subunit 2
LWRKRGTGTGLFLSTSVSGVSFIPPGLRYSERRKKLIIVIVIVIVVVIIIIVIIIIIVVVVVVVTGLHNKL